ncbi:hypothetical protein AKJ36_03335 [candidate division MSBL1 archaeon SCGC-AAA259I07]|uniref:Uncharacterized protein n=1 Tax=candidate division MSBL1 archaeon SCGC-AAA259I07 TaxID=1698266 RepID=A0A133UJ17_9EURY|nr:hypothetical protein AKJ36_03335 [candidate division MSBL1 archaeon SCGC-AAA259I07]
MVINSFPFLLVWEVRKSVEPDFRKLFRVSRIGLKTLKKEMGALDEERIKESSESLLEQAQKMAIDVYPISEEERKKIIERVEKQDEFLSSQRS